jgi:hypothetical protein
MTKLHNCKQFYWFKNTKELFIFKSSVFWNVIAGKKTRFDFELRKAICTLVRINCVNPRKDTQHLIFGQIKALTIILHHSSAMVGDNR